MYDLVAIKTKLEQKEIHLAYEALIFSISKTDDKNTEPKPILTVPICSHTNQKIISSVLKIINENF
jgi:hypothetical protein